ncbi:WXG100 family type VII secretion target [Streptomyces sp. CT34]|uniref:WXG100-like domain-containing protein n=1 Tax=Streptomyces sp. CT34 TaxID=1553907 RepID=UPI00321FA9EF
MSTAWALRHLQQLGQQFAEPPAPGLREELLSSIHLVSLLVRFCPFWAHFCRYMGHAFTFPLALLGHRLMDCCVDNAEGGIDMAIELPDEVVSFLQFIGVNWPNVNEDKVREFASHVRDFAQKLDDTHKDSTATIHQLAEVYQGASYEALLAKWGQLSNGHMTELVNACHTVATALDIAADTIVAMKVEAIGELIVLAITFVADQAAAAVTLGIAEAAEALVIAAGKKLVNFLEQQLEQYIIGQVIEAAINPLVDVVGKAVSGMVFQAAESALGVPATGGSGGGAGASFSIHPEELHKRAETLRGHAQTVASHAAEFESKAAGVSFE